MASQGETSGSSSEVKVDVVLRSPDPAKLKDLRLTVPLRWNVDELKWLISAEHPRKPSVSEQVLIYCGKVLTDGEAPLAQILKTAEGTQGPFTLHLTFRSEEPLTQSVSAPNLGDLHQSPPAAAATEVPSTSTIHSPLMAVPVVMVNPVVSAAYNAALAAVYNPDQSGRSGQPLTNALQPPTIRNQANPSTSPLSAVQQQIPQHQPVVPAIAFFPLGIPVLVPAGAIQNQGFQIGQNAAAFQQQPLAAPPQRHVHRRPPPPPLGRRGHGANAPHVRGRGVVVYRFSLRGLIQLALIVAVLYAYCSREQFILGVIVFVLLYLFARPIRHLIHNYYHARDADGRPRARGIIHEVLAILLTLVSSLFPNWNANEGPGAPFARVVREERAEENRAPPQNRPHAD